MAWPPSIARLNRALAQARARRREARTRERRHARREAAQALAAMVRHGAPAGDDVAGDTGDDMEGEGQ